MEGSPAPILDLVLDLTFGAKSVDGAPVNPVLASDGTLQNATMHTGFE